MGILEHTYWHGEIFSSQFDKLVTSNFQTWLQWSSTFYLDTCWFSPFVAAAAVILMAFEMTFDMSPLCCGLNSKLSFRGLLHYLSGFSIHAPIPKILLRPLLGSNVIYSQSCLCTGCHNQKFSSTKLHSSCPQCYQIYKQWYKENCYLLGKRGIFHSKYAKKRNCIRQDP